MLVHTLGGLPGDSIEDDQSLWILTWRHTDDVVVDVTFGDADRSAIDGAISGLRELDEGAWADLVSRHPAPG